MHSLSCDVHTQDSSSSLLHSFLHCLLVLSCELLAICFCILLLPDPLPSCSSPFSPCSVSPFLLCLFALRIRVYARVVPLSSFHILLLFSSSSLCLFLLPLLPLPCCSAFFYLPLVISCLSGDRRLTHARWGAVM